jgi:hypothetical protein
MMMYIFFLRPTYHPKLRNFANRVQKQKATRGGSLFFKVQVPVSLLGADRFNGTYVSAGTAVSTQLGINHVNITFADRLHRALVDAGTARGAFVRNYVSHILKVINSNKQM